MIVWKANWSLIRPSFFARVTTAPAHTRDIQYFGCYGEHILNSWEKKWTKTHLNALFVQALYDLPLVLRDDACFLHVAKCGESLLHLHVEVSLTFRQEQESLVKCALEQSRVKDVKKIKRTAWLKTDTVY